MAVSESKYKSLLARMRREREEGRSMVMTVVETVEVQASAGTHGLIDGYFEGVSVLGVPIGFLTGGALHLIGALGLAPEHMHALGNGAFAQPVAEMGRQFGEKLRTGEAAAPAATASGRRIITAGGRALSDAQLRSIAMRG